METKYFTTYEIAIMILVVDQDKKSKSLLTQLM